ncbi:hypothetical protein A3Q56_07105 [Intoshia linei]|uniref:Uncharacterized protein n=1 Tax=Intoshia linei TaxID=1819745 RepID=A0A177ATP9_9BILA|nr:hypothetical protein A3Q56_07105 [Intoshia linei]
MQQYVNRRRIFATMSIILVICSPGDPCQLWENNKDELSQEFIFQIVNQIEINNDAAYNMAIIPIENNILTM